MDKRQSVVLLTFFLVAGMLCAQLPKPYLLKEFNSTDNTVSCTAKNLTYFNEQLYFSAAIVTDGLTHYSLWKTDGTIGGTLPVKAVQPFMQNEDTSFTVIGNKFYFMGFDQSSLEYGIWVSDGTTQGTQLVRIFDNGNFPVQFSGFLELNGKLLFRATETNGTGLWMTDGTPNGTTLLSIYPQNGTSEYYPKDFFVANDKAYFTGLVSGNKTDLWTTDGTPEGTIFLKSFTGQFEPILEHYDTYNGKFLFSVVFPNESTKLYISDGTPAGTIDLGKIASPVYYKHSNHILYNGLIYFAGISLGKEELWKSDGTVAGTQAVTQNTDVYPANFTIHNNYLYFVTGNNNAGASKRIWRSDGTSQNTILLDDFDYTLTNAKEPLRFYDGKLFCCVKSDNADPSDDKQLWVTNGEPNGLHLLKQLNTSGEASPHDFFHHGGKTYFWARMGNDNRLWTTDGTTDNTLVFDSLYEDNNGGFLPVGDLMYVMAKSIPTTGSGLIRLYFTDGTPDGTYQMLPANAEYEEFNYWNPHAAMGNSLVYINNYVGTIGEELYIIHPDGSSSTHSVANPTLAILAYPNPSNGLVNFKLDNARPVSQCRIQDMNGQLIAAYELEGVTSDGFSVEIPQKGVFLASIQFKDGHTAHQRIVVF